MPAVEVKSGEFGQKFQVQVVDSLAVARDISSYTTTQLRFKDPAGAVTTKTAVFVTDGTDGWLEYERLTGEFDTAGPWKIDAGYAKTGEQFWTKSGKFTVVAV
jgi:hypothetical protein